MSSCYDEGIEKVCKFMSCKDLLLQVMQLFLRPLYHKVMLLNFGICVWGI